MPDLPAYVQLRRTAGWRKPPCAVSVVRGTPFGNPFTVEGAIEAGFAATEAEARQVCVERYRDWLEGTDYGDPDVIVTGRRAYDRRWVRAHLPELAGRTLACWCPEGEPWCHRRVLTDLAPKAARLFGAQPVSLTTSTGGPNA